MCPHLLPPGTCDASQGREFARKLWRANEKNGRSISERSIITEKIVQTSKCGKKCARFFTPSCPKTLCPAIRVVNNKSKLFWRPRRTRHAPSLCPRKKGKSRKKSDGQRAQSINHEWRARDPLAPLSAICESCLRQQYREKALWGRLRRARGEKALFGLS